MTLDEKIRDYWKESRFNSTEVSNHIIRTCAKHFLDEIEKKEVEFDFDCEYIADCRSESRERIRTIFNRYIELKCSCGEKIYFNREHCPRCKGKYSEEEKE